MRQHPMFSTAGELSARGRDHIPTEYQTGCHLVYSSPATLAYQSPGAEGFGVKRAGLSIPGSVMLIVSPGCCARNTSSIAELPGYRKRFFYLEMNETDLVTGRHLKRIPRAARAVVESLDPKPTLLMICITCVDALLGTDMERVARRAEEACGIPVRPCYMYALTREGTKPPMVQVRQSLYSLLQPSAAGANGTSRASQIRTHALRAVNILGFFSPLEEGCEVLSQLRAIGVEEIRQIATCTDMDDFQAMADADLNIVLNPEARPAADDLADRLGIPYIELTRLYQIDQIRRQYTAFGHALGYELASPKRERQAIAAVKALQEGKPDLLFSIGEVMNGNAFELSLALLRYGFRVAEIFANPAPEYYVYLDQIAKISPDTRVYSNMHPSMLWYRGEETPQRVDVTIGKDAAWYHPESRHVYWNADEQPFGYAGVTHLFNDIGMALAEGRDVEARTAVQILQPGQGTDDDFTFSERMPGLTGKTLVQSFVLREDRENAAGAVSASGAAGDDSSTGIKGFRKKLTPFAPDQSGAEAVLYDLGGLMTILDAGGCTGNICGFDEPRWTHSGILPEAAGHQRGAALFSAGLRDMDAIMGRDELLVEKMADAQQEIGAPFAAVIGTPVPSVIGTDYHALRRMAERQLKIPVLAIDTNGMDLYDRGEEKACLELFRELTRSDSAVPCTPVVGVIGLTLLEVSSKEEVVRTRQVLEKRFPGRRIVIYGQGATLEDVRNAGGNERNIVVSPAGIQAAEYLRQRFGTPYEVTYPALQSEPFSDCYTKDWRILRNHHDASDDAILIIHQQVLANTLRERILEEAGEQGGFPTGQGTAQAESPTVVCASFFRMRQELMQEGDVQLREEGDLQQLLEERRFTAVIADPALRQVAGEWKGRWIPLPHMAVSGRLGRE